MAKTGKRKKVNKLALAALAALVILIGLGVGWHYRRAIRDSLFPKDPEVLQKSGDKAMEAQEYRQATKAYAEAAHWCKDTDKKNQALLKQATAHLNVAWKTPDLADTVRREQYLGAKALLKKILRRSPKFADAQRLLCDVAWAESSRRDAPAAAWQEYIRQAGKLIAIAANEDRAYFRRGWANAQLAKDRKGEFIPAALKDMNHAIKIKSDIPDYWIGLANFTQWQGKHKEADKIYRKSLTTNPNNARLRVAYSLFLRRRDRSDEAIKQLREAIKRQPTSTIGHLALAGFYRAEKKYDDALRILESARKIDDSDFRIYGEMATIHAIRKQPKDVVRILKLGLAAIERRGKDESATKPARVQNARLKEAKVQLTVMLVDALLDMVTAKDKNSKELMAQARKYAEQINELTPNSAFRAKIFGRIALLDGKFSEATKLLEKAYEGFKSIDAGTVNLLVKLYLRQGLPGKAEAIVDRILQARPTPSAMVLKAMLLMEYRQYEGAKEMLVQALRYDPKNAEAKTMLRSLLAIEKGSIPETLGANRRSIGIILERAVSMLLTDKRAEGIKLIEDLHRKAPGEPIVVTRLVEVYLAQGLPQKAKAILQQAIALRPAKAEGFKSLLALIEAPPEKRLDMQLVKADKIEDKLRRALVKAQICAASRKSDLYIKYLKQAVAIKGDDPRVISRMFAYAVGTKDWKLAEEYLAKAKAANLDGCDGKIFSAELAVAKKDLDKAISDLNEALKNRPELKRARVMLGQCYLRNKDVDNAEHAFSAAAADDPGYAPAVVGMARITQIQGKWDKHAEWIGKAYRLAPNDPYVREQYLLLMEEKSKPQAIIEKRAKLLKRQPGNMVNRMRLGVLYERVGNIPEAEKMFVAISKSTTGTRLSRAAILAGFYARRRQFDKVDAIYDSLLAKIKVNTEKVTAYLNYGDILARYNPNLAMAAFKKAVESDPKDSRGHLVMGRYLASRRQWSDAVKSLDKYLTIKPDDRPIRKTLSHYLIEDRQFDRALRQLKRLQSEDATDVVTLTLMGVLSMRQKDLEAAEKFFNQAVAVNPNYSPVLVNRAQLYILQGQNTKAKNDLQAAARISPDPTILMRLGRFYMSIADLDNALMTFQEILGRNKGYIPAIDGLINIYTKQKSWSRLESLLAQSKKIYPKVPGFYLAEARMWTLRGQKGRAMKELSAAFQMAPDSPIVLQSYLFGLLDNKRYRKILDVCRPIANKKEFAVVAATVSGMAMMGLEKPIEAEKLFLQALARAQSRDIGMVVMQIQQAYGLTLSLDKLTGWLKVRQKDWNIHFLLGGMFFRDNRPSKSIEMFQKACDLADNDFKKVRAKARLGGVYYQVGKFPEAQKAYTDALAVLPDDMESLNNLAYLCANELNKPADAIKYAERALKQRPDDANILDTYGWALARAGKYYEAEKHLEKSVRTAGSGAPARYHLGWVFEKVGRVTQAELYYNRALKMIADGKDKRLELDIKKAMERLKKLKKTRRTQ